MLKAKHAMARGPYRSYGLSTREEAFEAIEKGMSVRKAAVLFKVPRTTLRDRVSKRYDIKKNAS